MNALVSFEVMVSVEALRALIALERSVVLRVGLSLRMAVHVLHMCCVATVVGGHHRGRHASNKCELAVGVAYIG